MKWTLHSVILLTILWSCSAQSQPAFKFKDSLNNYTPPAFYHIDEALANTYPFINFASNYYKFYTPNSKNWEKLYMDLKRMVVNKDRKLNFYHIGGSHLQADIYTHDIRTYLQTKWVDLPGERGLVFPFDLARTNNPGNYEFSSVNTWKSFRSVSSKRTDGVEYGLLGAVVQTYDSAVNIHFKYDRTTIKPGFTRLRIYHNKGFFPYDVHFGDLEIFIVDKYHNDQLGFTEVVFTDPVETFNVEFIRTIAEPFALQIGGFQLANASPGISYSTIGVNGAGLYTYLANVNFEEQLKESPPDFFAFSVGTNDANVPYDSFRPEVYKRNLETIIQRVLRANPNCAILLTVPNDAGYKRKYLNKNVAREREVIIELAQQYECAVWDLYGIMGELGASRMWMRNGLMQPDLVHFTGKGYHLKADLFIDAMEKWFEQMDKRK